MITIARLKKKKKKTLVYLYSVYKVKNRESDISHRNLTGDYLKSF